MLRLPASDQSFLTLLFLEPLLSINARLTERRSRDDAALHFAPGIITNRCSATLSTAAFENASGKYCPFPNPSTRLL